MYKDDRVFEHFIQWVNLCVLIYIIIMFLKCDLRIIRSNNIIRLSNELNKKKCDTSHNYLKTIFLSLFNFCFLIK